MSSFVTYIIVFSQQKEGKTYFVSDLFLLVMVKHISIFNIFISNFTLCALFDEIASVEMFNEKFIMEVIILSKQYKNLFKN